MKTYKVQIQETLSLTVEVKAKNELEAEEKVSQAYYNSEYILDAENFVGVDFTVMPAKKREAIPC
jgi:hypothetical protein